MFDQDGKDCVSAAEFHLAMSGFVETVTDGEVDGMVK